MAKGGKSSATSATRKKHARRAAGDEIPLPLPTKKPKVKKGEKAPPKVKQYIPPVRPAPAQVDPLDSLGLASRLDKGLVVILRKLGKKDSVTKSKALEEIRAWAEHDENSSIISMIPVWLHHLPSLFMHSSRRLRLLAASLHDYFLQNSTIREAILFQIRDVLDATQRELVLGTWLLAAFDIDRLVAREAYKSWSRCVVWIRPADADKVGAEAPALLALESDELVEPLSELLCQALLAPEALFSSIFPPAPQVSQQAPSHGKRAPGSRVPPHTRTMSKDDDAPKRSDMDEESEEDRKARSRIGSLGATKWLISSRHTKESAPIRSLISRIISESHSFSVLAQSAHPLLGDTSSPPAGFNQPLVRRSAWAALTVLIPYLNHESCAELIAPLSQTVLFSAWDEPDVSVRSVMWEPLLTFLRAFPNAWILASTPTKEELEPPNVNEDLSEDQEDEEDEPSDPTTAADDKGGKPPQSPADVVEPGASLVFAHFRRFLELGFGGSPAQGYPTLVVILSTIPPAVLPLTDEALTQLFTSIWGAYDAKVLTSPLERQRRENVTAFVSAISECAGVYARKFISGASNGGTPTEQDKLQGISLIKREWGRLWSEALGGGLKLSPQTLGSLLGKGLLRLYGVPPELFQAGWEPLHVASLSAENTTGIDVIQLLSAISLQFQTAPKDAKVLDATITRQIAKWTAEVTAGPSPVLDGSQVVSKRVDVLENIMMLFSDRIRGNVELVTAISSLLDSQLSTIVRSVPPNRVASFLVNYLRFRNSDAQNSWDHILQTLSQLLLHPVEPTDASNVRGLLISLARNDHLPSTLTATEALTPVMENLSNSVLQDGNSEQVELLGKLLDSRGKLVSGEICDSTRTHLNSHFAQAASTLLNSSTQSEILTPLLPLFGSLPNDTSDAEESSFMITVFFLAHIGVRDDKALSLWTRWCKTVLPNVLEETAKHGLSIIRDSLEDIQCPSRYCPPVELLDLAAHLNFDNQKLHPLNALPSQELFEAEQETLRKWDPPSAFSILDPLVPSTSSPSKARTTPACDQQGLSSLARDRVALLELVSADRRLIHEHLWIIPQMLALENFARDFIALPSSPNPLFSREGASKGWHEHLVAKIQQTLAYAFSSLGADLSTDWHRTVTGALRTSKTRVAGGLGLGPLGDIVASAYWECLDGRAVPSVRTLYGLLRGLLREGSAEDSDLWLTLAQGQIDNASHIAEAIVHCVASLNLESPRLDRIRNEVAARISGVRPPKANSEGLRLLRVLNASAPPHNSEVVFLPQQRTVFMFQTLQRWVEEQDYLEEEVESQFAELFVHVAPILQSLPGAHWELIFNVVENNIDNSSMTEMETLPSLWRTLRLVIDIEDLVASNKMLRELWNERRSPVFTLLKKHLTTPIPSGDVSAPREVCRGLVVSLAAAFPQLLVDTNSVSTLCHLLYDPSLEVQLTVYGLLHHAAEPYTEKIVVDAEVDTGSEVKPKLPDELIKLVMDFTGEREEESLPHLLVWMVVFDLFTDASAKVKNGYLDHLRSTGVVENKLLPAIFALLNIGFAGRPLPLDAWAVDEFMVALLDDDTPESISILAAHVFYRALITVPSLVRTWWSECKDRQLSGTLATYTRTYFSPSIIKEQFSDVRDRETLSSLQDENFKVKVQANVNEIVASYLVDEQQMEMALHLPSDYPLHAIEVKDVARIGVQETKWRTWMLNVHQIAQTGLILDALFWFKRNVSSFFEGKVECAICYSVISVMDRSLPNKPCKTCKNRFHASCLYKWFNTSHSSSCPLCRSNIM
ncbi:hypothetical protein DL93DRAFT_2055777 [Clavulina sp. PMI_390]|nr:hypothetical protein DL93DRAFT_2055777 [Clavulina sp. PMI_390]